MSKRGIHVNYCRASTIEDRQRLVIALLCQKPTIITLNLSFYTAIYDKYLKRTDHLIVAQLNLLSIHGTVLQYDLSFRILDIRISFVYKNMFLGPAGINFAVLHTSL